MELSERTTGRRKRLDSRRGKVPALEIATTHLTWLGPARNCVLPDAGEQPPPDLPAMCDHPLVPACADHHADLLALAAIRRSASASTLNRPAPNRAMTSASAARATFNS